MSLQSHIDALRERHAELELRIAADEYERQVSERVAADEDAAAYVAQLEEAEDSEPDDGQALTADSLADEIEQFLREHRRDGG